MQRFLHVFVRVWLGLVIGANVLGIVGAFVGASSPLEAISTVLAWYSPFNLWTWGLNLVLLSPALGAYLLAERLESKAESSSAEK